MSKVMINHIPQLVKERGYSLKDFHRLMEQDSETKLSYQSLHRVANKDQYILPGSTKIETLQKIATVLGLTVNDLYSVQELSTN